MQAFSEMNAREKILVAILGVALILGGYLFTRGADLSKQVLVLEDRLESLEKKVTKAKKKDKKAQKVKLPELEGKKISSRDVKALGKQIESERSQLSGFGHVFVDLRDKSKLAKLIGDINLQAKTNNLHLLSKLQSRASLSQIANKQGGSNKTELNRPLYELRLQGGFSALYGFIKQLSTLEYSVVPTKLQVSRTDRTAIGGGRVLDIEMTLAL